MHLTDSEKADYATLPEEIPLRKGIPFLKTSRIFNPAKFLGYLAQKGTFLCHGSNHIDLQSLIPKLQGDFLYPVKLR